MKKKHDIFYGMLFILLMIAFMLVIRNNYFPDGKTRPPGNFSATIMMFNSPEGVARAEINIFGAAKRISFDNKTLLRDVEISGKTLFIGEVDHSKIDEEIIFIADGKEYMININKTQSWKVGDIRMENNDIILKTDIEPPLEDQRLLLWTTVQETKVRLDDTLPVTWIKKPFIGGYWLFDIKERKESMDIIVTPPVTFENSTPEDIAEVLLSKVANFNLIILGSESSGTLINITVPLAEAGSTLLNKTVEKELFQ